MERRKEYIDILEAEIGQAHPTLVLLIKQCLHNAPHRRPATEELLTRLQGIKVEVEGMYQSSLLAKVEVMRARLESQVAKKVNQKDSMSILPCMVVKIMTRACIKHRGSHRKCDTWL